MNVVVYAPKDRAYVEQLLKHIPGVQALPIQGALAQLVAMPIHYVLLLMSIHLLYALLCEAEYEDLYQRLRLYEREGIILVVALSPCDWKWSFTAPAFPAAKTVRHLRIRAREALYEQIATYICD